MLTYSQVKKLLKETDKDTLRELIEQFGEDLVFKYYDNGYSLDSMQEAYQGEYISDEDFTQELLEETGSIPKDIPAYVYIDWERTANDIMMDYFEIDGHYFRSL